MRAITYYKLRLVEHSICKMNDGCHKCCRILAISAMLVVVEAVQMLYPRSMLCCAVTISGRCVGEALFELARYLSVLSVVRGGDRMSEVSLESRDSRYSYI
jgi:hypothetical protein